MAENTSNEQYIKQAIGFQSNIEHHQQEAAKGNLTSHHAVLPKLEKQLSKCLEFCPSYANKTSKEMIEQYEQEFDKEYQNIHLLDCNKSDVDIVKKIYNEKYKKDDDEEESLGAFLLHMLQGKKDDVLRFKSEEEFKNFITDLAKEGINVTVMDANGNVKCYANGQDGKLYHADNNSEVQTHETLRSSTMKYEEFMAVRQQMMDATAAGHNEERASASSLPTPKPY